MDGRRENGKQKQNVSVEGERKLWDWAADRLGPSQLAVAKYTGHSSQLRWVRARVFCGSPPKVQPS